MPVSPVSAQRTSAMAGSLVLALGVYPEHLCEIHNVNLLPVRRAVEAFDDIGALACGLHSLASAEAAKLLRAWTWPLTSAIAVAHSLRA
jgi:hypothetical protein